MEIRDLKLYAPLAKKTVTKFKMIRQVPLLNFHWKTKLNKDHRKSLKTGQMRSSAIQNDHFDKIHMK